MFEAQSSWQAEIMDRPIGTLLYLGAGSGVQLQFLLDSEASHIVLLEPEPQRRAELLKHVGSDARVTVLPVAVADTTGQAQLYEFNQTSLSSLRPPTGLNELFPGLRQTKVVKVDTLTVADLLQQIPQKGELPDCLIVDTPGLEQLVVQHLSDIGQLQRFHYVFMRAGRQALYEGAAPFSEIRALLEDQGYRIATRSDLDPDFPEAYLCLDPLMLENMRQSTELQAAAERLLVAESEKAAALSQGDQAQKRIAELEAAQAAALSQGDQAQKRIAELESAQAAAESALEAQVAEIASATSARDAAQTQSKSLEQKLAENQRRLELCVQDLRRAEGQVKLLGDLLLQPAGL